MSPTKIRRLRERLGLNQIAFADLLGVRNETICRWERGARAPAKHFEAKLRELAERGAGDGKGAAHARENGARP